MDASDARETGTPPPFECNAQHPEEVSDRFAPNLDGELVADPVAEALICTYQPHASGPAGNVQVEWTLQPPIRLSGPELAAFLKTLNELPVLTEDVDSVVCQTALISTFRILVDRGAGNVEELNVDSGCGLVSNSNRVTRTGINQVLHDMGAFGEY